MSENLHPIQFVKGENFCRWRGESTENCLDLFGVEEPTILEETENYIQIGTVLYVKFGIPFEMKNFQCITEIRHYEDLSHIQLEKIRQFSKDIDDYYKRLVTNSWEDLEPDELLMTF